MKKKTILVIISLLLVFLIFRSSQSKVGLKIVFSTHGSQEEGVLFSMSTPEGLELAGINGTRLLGPIYFFEFKKRIQW